MERHENHCEPTGEDYVHNPEHWLPKAKEVARDLFEGHEQDRVPIDKPTAEGLYLKGIRDAQKHYHIGAPLGPGD